MIDPLKAADKVIDAIDDNYLSKQESEDIRTERHRIDMQSDSKYTKALRPLLATVAAVVWTYKEIASDYLENVDTTNATNVFTFVLSFYFVMRGVEKMQSRKSDAAIKIEQLKTRHDLREERRDNKAERRK